MKTVKAGIIGMGYIGESHIEAVRRIGFAEIVAVADTNSELAKRKADEYHIEKYYPSVEDMLADKSIGVIHNCTPNILHSSVNKAVLESGKHIFSEKPLARTFEEGAELTEFSAGFPNQAKGVNFNYRFNPMVMDMRAKIASGEIGTPWLVHGSYLQDWLLYDTDYNWRIEPEAGGPSRCVADIGSHWMDCVQFILNSRITEVCADLGIVHKIRKRFTHAVETFSVSKDENFTEFPVKTEDYGTVMFHMDNGASGVYHTSEVSAGHGCFFNIEVNGSKASLMWNQESNDRLWVGYRDKDNLNIIRNPAAMAPEARQYTALAKGHPEGWNDAFKNSIASFYRYIAEEGWKTGAKMDFATFENAAYVLRLVSAILESNRTRGWVKI